MKIVITGGTGLVGSNLARKLAEKGHDIVIITRKIAEFNDLNQFKFIEANISVEKDLIKLKDSVQYADIFVHLSASLIYFGEYNDLYNSNTLGTINAVNLAKKLGCKKFIYASSIEAAGAVSLSEMPADTNRKPLPFTNYGLTKVQSENFIKDNFNDPECKFAILRIGNVYGEEGLNYITFIADSLLNKTRIYRFLRYYSDRYIQPVHNDDVAFAMIKYIEECDKNIIATLADRPVKVGEIFELVAKFLGVNLTYSDFKLKELVYLKVRRYFHESKKGGGDFISYLLVGNFRKIHRAYSLKELHEDLGYIVRIPIDAGIVRTLVAAKKRKLISY